MSSYTWPVSKQNGWRQTDSFTSEYVGLSDKAAFDKEAGKDRTAAVPSSVSSSVLRGSF